MENSRVPWYIGKRERTGWKIYIGISLLNEDGKIYAGVLVDKVHVVKDVIIDD